MITAVNASRCYTCQTGPERIICGVQTACNGRGCYVMVEGNSNAAGCTSDVDTSTKVIGCYNETSTRKICACYSDFCNTPIGVSTFVSLPYSPFTANLSAPWDKPSSNISTTTVSMSTGTTAFQSSTTSFIPTFPPTTTSATMITTTNSSNTLFIPSYIIITIIILTIAINKIRFN